MIKVIELSALTLLNPKIKEWTFELIRKYPQAIHYIDCNYLSGYEWCRLLRDGLPQFEDMCTQYSGWSKMWSGAKHDLFDDAPISLYEFEEKQKHIVEIVHWINHQRDNIDPDLLQLTLFLITRLFDPSKVEEKEFAISVACYCAGVEGLNLQPGDISKTLEWMEFYRLFVSGNDMLDKVRWRTKDILKGYFEFES